MSLIVQRESYKSSFGFRAARLFKEFIILHPAMNEFHQLCLLSLVFLFYVTHSNGSSAFGYEPRIIGGTPSEVGRFPYHVALRNLTHYFCGGAIITTRHILTSATCVRPQIFRHISVISGTNSMANGGETHGVAYAAIHDDYLYPPHGRHTNNVALLILIEEMKLTPLQSPIPLRSSDLPAGATVVFTGWGTTIVGSKVLPATLQYANLFTISTWACRLRGPSIQVDDNHLCAVNDFGIGSCFGDEGGPLTYNGELVGIFSFRDTVCGSNAADVFTRLTTVKEFINGHTGLQY